MNLAIRDTSEREAFYRTIDDDNLSALWNVLGDLVTPQPRSPVARICGASI